MRPELEDRIKDFVHVISDILSWQIASSVESEGEDGWLLLRLLQGRPWAVNVVGMKDTLCIASCHFSSNYVDLHLDVVVLDDSIVVETRCMVPRSSYPANNPASQLASTIACSQVSPLVVDPLDRHVDIAAIVECSEHERRGHTPKPRVSRPLS